MTTLNFNIGVLGHVDSGKTSLVKVLSTIASTACFDKNPQSKERGITLDLGFSSFYVDAPNNIKSIGYDNIQYTLVDCPGHASLIRTIIGGAQIIDMMLLVIDIVKGIQTQTAECLIIGEITCNKMLIVLNKLDLIEQSKQDSIIDKMTKRLHKTLENTKFSQCPIIALAANPNNANDGSNVKPYGVNNLIDKLKEITFVPNRISDGPFLFAIDHCFNIKGQGTVMTGTILNGQIKNNDTIEIPSLKVHKKIKSMQMFRKPIDQAIQGDRLGICVTNFDAKLIERGIACSPDYVKNAYGVIIKLNKIKHFKGSIEAYSRFHISIGHETVIGKIDIFGEVDKEVDLSNLNINNGSFDFNKDFIYVDRIENDNDKIDNQNNATEISNAEINDSNSKKKIINYYLLIDFSDQNNDQSVLCTPNSLVIGSKLDTDIHLNQCRIAFYGNVLHYFTSKDYYSNGELNKLKVYKEKSKEGVVDRMTDQYTIIGKSLFKKETNIDLFVNLKVKLSTGEYGIIEGNFGQSGKFKVRVPNGLLVDTQEILSGNNKSKKKTQDSNNNPNTNAGPIKIFLNFKKYVHDEKKKIVQ